MHELLTQARLREIAGDLDDDGMHGEALWYRARVREMRARGLGTYWHRNGQGPVRDLGTAVHRCVTQMIQAGKRSAYFCSY